MEVVLPAQTLRAVIAATVLKVSLGMHDHQLAVLILMNALDHRVAETLTV